MFGDDGAEIQQKIRELENALLESQKETKNVITENAKLKAEARMAPIVSRYSKRPSSRDRGLPTHASEEDEIRNAKEEAKHYKDGYNEMTESRDEMYEWYAETHNEYAEEREKSIELSEANKSLRDKISEAEASSSSHLAPATSTIMKVSRKEESKIKTFRHGPGSMILDYGRQISFNRSSLRPMIQIKSPGSTGSKKPWTILIRTSLSTQETKDSIQSMPNSA